MNLKVTNKCNMACEFCYRDKSSVDDLELSDIKTILKNMKELNSKILRISGGEPLLYKNIVDVIQLASEYNISTSMATNGILINASNAKKLKCAGLKGLNFSLGDMSDLNKNIFIQKKINEIEGVNLEIGINIITSKLFIENIANNLDWIYDNLNIDYINCIIPKKGDNINWYNDNKINIDELYILKKELIESGLNYKFDCGYYVGTIADNKDCWLFNSENKFLTVSTNGFVYECPYSCDEAHSLGHFKNLKEILYNYNIKYDKFSVPCK